MSDLKALKEKFGDHCVFDAPASTFTTYRAGGRAEALVRPGTPEELLWLSGWCRENGAPLLVLGRGSNVLVSDKGLPGVTALTERLSAIKLEGSAITAQAGVLWDDLARLSAESGLAGFEKASGIPGSVGGAVRMNAGAFGQETFDRLVSIEAFDREGRPVKLEKKNLSYGYRRVDGLGGLTIVSARFEFEPGETGVLLQDRSCVLAARETKQPLEYPSAGSVFKRPQGDYASRLIDAAGLKGFKVGGAEVSAKHAGFIVNTGGATAAEIYALMGEVRARVKAQSGVELELEQILLGEFK
jgi:UDP-N-acetylmuramate dehydrogenase